MTSAGWGREDGGEGNSHGEVWGEGATYERMHERHADQRKCVKVL